MPTLQDFAALIARFKKGIIYLGLYVLVVSVVVFPFHRRDHPAHDP